MWRSIKKYLLNNRMNRNGIKILLAGRNTLCHPKQVVPFQDYRQHTPAAFNISVPIRAIQKVEAFDKQRCITVHWEDGSHSQYPYVWLRDNCQCPQCFLSSAKARKLSIEDLDVNIYAEKVTLTDSKISVVWPDQHLSEFDSNWLKIRRFAQSARKEKQEQLFLRASYYHGNWMKCKNAAYYLTWTIGTELERNFDNDGNANAPERS